jgi:hypothetical protein
VTSSGFGQPYWRHGCALTALGRDEALAMPDAVLMAAMHCGTQGLSCPEADPKRIGADDYGATHACVADFPSSRWSSARTQRGREIVQVDRQQVDDIVRHLRSVFGQKCRRYWPL